MSEFTHFAPRKPESFTVKAGSQTLLSKRESSGLFNVLYITNNSDVPVFLGFTETKDTKGNAAVNAGITVFPKSTFVFDDPVPSGCSVWATCESGEAIVGVQE
jgi:hypothetical protein